MTFIQQFLNGLQLGSLYALSERGRSAHHDSSEMVRAILPWLLLLLLVAFAGVSLFTQPMEMRGTVGFGH